MDKSNVFLVASTRTPVRRLNMPTIPWSVEEPQKMLWLLSRNTVFRWRGIKSLYPKPECATQDDVNL